MTAKSWRTPLLLSGFVLLSQAFPLLSPVRDAATGAWPQGFSLHLPVMYVILAPLYGIADRLTLLSIHQLMLMVAFLISGGFILLGLKRGAAFLLAVIVFVGWAMMVPRSPARLVAQDPETLFIDFHSHTRASHDGRPSFTAEANMRWHERQGFHAAFITDHNRVESVKEAKSLSLPGYRSLAGEEISLWKTHLVVLGNPVWIDNQPYDSDPAKVLLFIRQMNKDKLPVIAALPEYWEHHWGDGIQTLLKAGINGFEIVNSAPKALDFPPAYRREIVELCRAHNLFMTGVSDNHGYGYATAVWSAMRIPGWRHFNAEQLQAAVLKNLETEKFIAVQVLERARYNPDNTLQLVASPFINVVLYWRSLQPLEAISWVLWIFAFWCRRQFYVRKN